MGRGTEQTFIPKDMQMANKCIKGSQHYQLSGKWRSKPQNTH